MSYQKFEPGAKAIIVKSHAGNEGKIVELIQLIGIAPIVNGTSVFEPDNAGEEVWHVKTLGSSLSSPVLGSDGSVIPNTYLPQVEILLAKSKLRLLPFIDVEAESKQYEKITH